MRNWLLILMLTSLTLCATGHAEWLAVNSPLSDQVPAVDVQREGSSNWQMNITIPGFDIESFTENGQTFQRLTLPDELMASADGEAALPLVSRVIALGSEGNPQLEIVSQEWMDLEGTYDLTVDAEDVRAMEMAGSYATRDEYLPSTSFGVTPRQVMGGVSLAVVYIHPAKYNPAQKKIQVLKSAELRLHEQGSPLSYDHPITETTASILRAVVPNWDEISLNLDIVRGTLLCICANSTTVPSGIQDLVKWREKKGYTVEVAGPDEIGSMTATNIKAYIQGRYNAANPPLEFVCLVGDAGGSFSVPCYYYTGFWYHSTGAGDWDYTRLDGNDLLPDVAIGRLCFGTLSELAVIVNKIFYYEREPAASSGGSNPNWYKGGGCFAGSGSGISPVTTMRWIRERMLDVGFTSSSIDTVYFTNETVNATKINASINSGVALWCYRGYLNMSGYDTGDLSGLSNGRRLPFITTLTCGTNDYDGYSVCEGFVKTGSIATQKGAIGVVGMSSIDTRTRFNNCVSAGIVQGLLREGIHTMGGSLSRAKLELEVNYPVDSTYAAFFCGISTLIGDPAVDVFTDTPETLVVNNPASLSVGTNTLTLTVTNNHGQTVSDAYVNLMKGTEVFMGDWTNGAGQVVFNFTTTSAETLFVTASKHNCRPATNFARVTTSTRFVSPASSTFAIDDDNSGQSSGNGDGLANPGETIELAMPLKNWGTQTANGVSAVLSTTDPFIAGIGNNYENYGNIPAGSTVSPPGAFVFTVGPYAPEAHVVQFTLTVTDNVPNTWVSAIPITMSNGKLEYFRYNVDGVGHGIVYPGDTGQLWLRLNNVGTRAIPEGTIAYLRSGNPSLIVTDSTGTFTGADPGADCNNQAEPFGIHASTYTLAGQRIPLTAIFPLANGFADTIQFKLDIGTVFSTTPCPPDSYGYWAFDNTDTSYAKHPTYDWIEVDSRYGGSGTNLNVTDNADEADKTVAVNLPFTFKYYGQNFTRIAVCSNGWLAMGSDQAVHTFFRNWHIPAALGPEAMIAPFWDDLRVTNTSNGGRIYTYHDASNHRFIVEWSRVYKYNGNSNPDETFEVVLYQPGYPATPTGDGEILFQYMDCTNSLDESDWEGAVSNDYATVGIENLDQSDGVLYSYFNIASPGAASMTSGRAILFTTQSMPPVAPETPTNVTTISVGSDIQLRWNAVREDILGQPITVTQYNIYRDTTPDFTPGGGNYLSAATDTSYLDVGAASGGKYFYVIQAYVDASLASGQNSGENHGAMMTAPPSRETRVRD